MRKGHGAVGALVLTLVLTTATAWAGTIDPAEDAPGGAAEPTSTAPPTTSTVDTNTSTVSPSTSSTAMTGTSTTGPAGPSISPSPTTGPRVTAAQTECLPNYPTVCVPQGPDLDCDDIDATDFPVNGSDPFRLDDDGDGAACERPASVPPAASGPAAAPPSTATPVPPPTVAGATQAPGGATTSSRLAATGAAVERSVLAVVMLLTGLALVGAAGVVGNPASGRRGGFTVVSVDRNGTTFVNHVTASGR